MTLGAALTTELTSPLSSPGGVVAGARAMKSEILSFRSGLIDKEAKACAVP